MAARTGDEEDKGGRQRTRAARADSGKGGAQERQGRATRAMRADGGVQERQGRATRVTRVGDKGDKGGQWRGRVMVAVGDNGRMGEGVGGMRWVGRGRGQQLRASE